MIVIIYMDWTVIRYRLDGSTCLLRSNPTIIYWVNGSRIVSA
jgi:hypothetical protein